jgi:hypothetical protein
MEDAEELEDLGGMEGAARISAKRLRWISNWTNSIVVRPRRRAQLSHRPLT